jgi:acetate---CoA ligase (ADP-forming)
MPDFRDLSFLLDPQSVAIVGASPKGGWPARIWANLQHFDYRGRVYPVNPNYETMWDMKCYRSLEELPETVDHAIIIIPAARVVELLRNNSRVPFRSATIYSGGFGEGGDPEGLKRKEFLQGYARETGIRFCGPNCMGLVSTKSRAVFFPDQRLADMREGGLAIVSQSGGLLGSLARALVGQGIGLSYFVTSGNEADAELSDYFHHFLQDSQTRVVAAFVEGVRDGEKFLAVAREALAQSKPIIVLKVGRSAKGRAAALAHTGALAGNDRVFDAACLQNGIIRVNDLDELLNTVELFLHVNKPPAGRRAAIVTFSGGLRGLVSDLAQDSGLELPDLQPATESELSGMLDVGTAVGNPLDTGWGGLSSQQTYLRCVSTILGDPGIDLLAIQEELPLSGVRPDKESNLLALAQIAAESPKPITVFSMITQSVNDYGREFKARCALPFLQGADNTVKGVKHLGEFSEAVRRYAQRHVSSATSLKPLTSTAREKLIGERILNEWEAYPIIAESGIAAAQTLLAADLSEAFRAAEAIRYPVALKLNAPEEVHKTELGGVRLNIGGPEELQRCWREMEAVYRNHKPGGALHGFLVQEMMRGGVETILGAIRDDRFGPAVMFGLGGEFVELYQDVAFRLAPVTRDEAAQMVRSVKGFPLLAGFRGRAPVDMEALCQAIVSLSELMVAGADLIESIDINPFVCLPQGGKAVDAVIITRERRRKSKD